VPQSWTVTSDSLALWLAETLDAPQLLLVKARAVPPGTGIAALASDGLVDAAFPDLLARYSGAVFVAGPEDLPAGLDPRALPGVAIRALA
jgi:5-(aminomethyl)-3-furanmethanol phosphate kinase